VCLSGGSDSRWMVAGMNFMMLQTQMHLGSSANYVCTGGIGQIKKLRNMLENQQQANKFY